MCGIAGIVNNEPAPIGLLLHQMLETMQHRGPDGAGYVIDRTLHRAASLKELHLAGKVGRVGLGHVRLAITGEMAAVQPFRSEEGGLTLLHNGEVYNYRQLRSELDDPKSVRTGSDSEVILRLIEETYDGDLSAVMHRLLPRLDGVYALAITDGKETVIARDRIGVRQLYYLENLRCAAFASEKKPLLALANGHAPIQRLLPGQMIAFGGDRSQAERFWDPESLRDGSRIEGRLEALEAYESAIREAVRKRLAGRERVGIIFSGGIDSLLIAHLARQEGVDMTCYTAGLDRGAADVDWARELADRLDFPLQVRILDEAAIEALIPEVIRDIEDQSLNQVEVAIPIHAAMRMAQEAGERVIVTGQGADELFGGYPWYPTIVDREGEGYPVFERRSWEDTLYLYKECLEREDKISMAHSLELRVPYLDPEVIRVAFRIAPELKIHRGGDVQGKRIHRELCLLLELPGDVVWRPKEAAQHGANIHAAIVALARRHSPSPERLEQAGYDPDRTVTEKLGSSSRYGYRYGDRHLWEPQPEVQYYLDSVAAEIGMLPPIPLAHWEAASERLAARETTEA